MGKFVIQKIKEEEIDFCANLIRQSFQTVAEEFHLTIENCPTNGAFIQTDRLMLDWNKGNLMFGLVCGENDEIVGFMELERKSADVYELEKLAVLPTYRNRGYGSELIHFAKSTVVGLGAEKITIGIIDENIVLKEWYQDHDFKETGKRDFAHLPFTVGFMEWNG